MKQVMAFPNFLIFDLTTEGVRMLPLRPPNRRHFGSNTLPTVLFYGREYLVLPAGIFATRGSTSQLFGKPVTHLKEVAYPCFSTTFLGK
jgi:hypothetical protein